MNRKSILIVTGILLAIAAALIWGNMSFKPVRANHVFALKAPVSSQNLRGNATSSTVGSLLDNAAGISAYFQTSPIVLSSVHSLFRSIETETSSYILGTFTLPNNNEDYDVHVYIHQSGWVLIYYLKADPAVEIFDWQTYTGTMNPTRFQVAANTITTALSRSNPTLTYYDFRYPNATNLLLAIEDLQVMNTTEGFTIPVTGFTYYERSWVFGGKMNGYESYYSAHGRLFIDSVQIIDIDCYDCTEYHTGSLDAITFPSTSSHVVQVQNSDSNGGTLFIFGAVSIVYGP